MSPNMPPIANRFQKGGPGGPGRPSRPPEDSPYKLTRTSFQSMATKMLAMDKAELSAKMKDPKTPMIEVMVGSIIIKAATGGDQSRLDFLLNRLIGKVPDKLKHEVAKGQTQIDVSRLTTEQLDKLEGVIQEIEHDQRDLLPHQPITDLESNQDGKGETQSP